MAEITATREHAADRSQIITWEEMGNADTGSSVKAPDYPDKTFQITGTFGGATVTIEGSNDGTNWETLTDVAGNSASYTAAAMAAIAENPLYIRAATTGGSGTDVDVTVAIKKY